MGSSTSTDPRVTWADRFAAQGRGSSVTIISVDGSVTEMDADGH
jgi:hypothetical protein